MIFEWVVGCRYIEIGAGFVSRGRLEGSHVYRCHSNSATIILFLASSSKSS